MGTRDSRRSALALAAAGVASAGVGALSARNLLINQAAQTREVIPRAFDVPPRADGIYLPEGGPVQRYERDVPVDLHLMIFGDSTATGYGCTQGDEVPGVLLARGLAAQSGKRIRLSTKAIVGATSKGLSGQVDAMFVAGPPPDAAVIMIGANDITALNWIPQSARRLGNAVKRLQVSGAVVVVGTCPDFGIITAIPQPLRWVTRALGLRLARAQAGAVRAAGGVPVPLADLLTPDFLSAPDRMLSDDRFHPSADGYELAAQQLLPALCYALGEGYDQLPWESKAAEERTLGTRLRMLARLGPRRTTGVPAPLVASSD